MTTLPPKPNFKEESDTYFLWTYRKAVDEQFHIVDMDRWRLPDLKHSQRDLMQNWVTLGFGRIVYEDDGHTKHTRFSISDAGVLHGKRLLARAELRGFRSSLRRNLVPALNTIGTLVAAVAALAAAYFSYLALPGR